MLGDFFGKKLSFWPFLHFFTKQIKKSHKISNEMENNPNMMSSIQGIRKKWMQGFLPKKSPSIFSCLDLILWPNVSNIFGDDFVPHHLVFYEIF